MSTARREDDGAGNHDAERHERVRRHVQKGFAQIDVAFALEANNQAVTPLTTMPHGGHRSHHRRAG